MRDRTICPLTTDWQETFVDTMRLAEERGCCVTMRGLIKDAEADVTTYGDAILVTDYEAFKKRAEEAFAYEEAHGKYSLLKLDHPSNVRLIEEGILKLPEAA